MTRNALYFDTALFALKVCRCSGEHVWWLLILAAYQSNATVHGFVTVTLIELCNAHTIRGSQVLPVAVQYRHDLAGCQCCCSGA